MIGMILFVVLWLNSLPPDIRIHQTYSLRKIIMNRNLEYMKNCRVEFETYAEAHDDATPTKTVAGRPKDAIFLGATKKFQRSCKFLSLRTGQRIKRKKVHIIAHATICNKKVEDMAIKDNLMINDRNRNTLKVYDDYSPTG